MEVRAAVCDNQGRMFNFGRAGAMLEKPAEINQYRVVQSPSFHIDNGFGIGMKNDPGIEF